MTSSIMKKRIMFGVYTIFFVRKLKNPFITELLAFGLLVAVLFYFVSIPNVLTNMTASGNFYNYFVMAFSNTDFLVKLVLVLTAITVLVSMRHLTFYTLQLKHRFA